MTGQDPHTDPQHIMTLLAEKPGRGSVVQSLCSEMKANYLFREKILGNRLKTGSS